MDDIVYKIRETSGKKLDLVPRFRDELGDQSIFYTGSGECMQKIMVGRKSYDILLHASLFSNKQDNLESLSDKQLRLFYNISKNKLK